jgi:hypothetical protein
VSQQESPAHSTQGSREGSRASSPEPSQHAASQHETPHGSQQGSQQESEEEHEDHANTAHTLAGDVKQVATDVKKDITVAAKDVRKKAREAMSKAEDDATYCMHRVATWYKDLKKSSPVYYARLKTDATELTKWLKSKYEKLKSEGKVVDREIHEKIIGLWDKYAPKFKAELSNAWADLVQDEHKVVQVVTRAVERAGRAIVKGVNEATAGMRKAAKIIDDVEDPADEVSDSD